MGKCLRTGGPPNFRQMLTLRSDPCNLPPNLDIRWTPKPVTPERAPEPTPNRWDDLLYLLNRAQEMVHATNGALVLDDERLAATSEDLADAVLLVRVLRKERRATPRKPDA